MPASVLEERQLDLDEKPLVVQLNWNKDDREGRFVLKNENDVLPKVSRWTSETLTPKSQTLFSSMWFSFISSTAFFIFII